MSTASLKLHRRLANGGEGLFEQPAGLRWRARLFGNVRITLGAGVILLLVAAAALAPWLQTSGPNKQVLIDRLQPPSSRHFFGTDVLGQDIYSRILWAARVSLSVSLAAMLITVIVGAAFGLLAGYLGGIVDEALMRLTDVFLAFPVFMLLVTVISIYGSGIPLLILFLGLTAWPVTARTVRAEILSLRRRDFVEAARVSGASAPWILRRHLLPNVTSVIVVSGTLRVASVILIEAALSYFGLGVPPTTPTWGNMIADGRLYLGTAWWISAFPGVVIMITVLAYNLLGEGLRDQLDPHRRRR
jgi:peptide/nickel transport system permease protein